jgi:hypothetical protein
LFTFDRVLLRSSLICIVAVAGILYELFKISPPRWQLIAGYGAIIAFAVFRMAKRPQTQDPHETSNHTS